MVQCAPINHESGLLQEMAKLKMDGNDFYKAKQYAQAVLKYSEALCSRFVHI